MWGWIHRLFRRPRQDQAVLLTVESLAGLVAQLQTDSSSLLDKPFRSRVDEVLVALQNKCNQVERDASGYPRNPIRGDVWMDGASLAPVAERLAQVLRARGATDLERWAHILRCRAVLAVQSHYHYIVGPAMLSRTDCEERLGNVGAALGCYDAVIADLSFLVEDYETESDAPNSEDRASLICLSRAIQSRRTLEDTSSLVGFRPGWVVAPLEA